MARITEPESPIDLIERIWAGTLDWSLADQISKSPTNKLQDFAEEYSSLINAARAPELSSGVLRPEIRRTYLDDVRLRPHRTPIESGLDLLLYAPEVLVDDPLDLGYLSRETAEELRDEIGRAVHSLAVVRPLVKSGCMRFALLARTRHPAYSGDKPGDLDSMIGLLKEDLRVRSGVENLMSNHPIDEFGAYQSIVLDVFASLKLLRYWTRQFTPLMHGTIEMQALECLLDTAGGAFRDGRVETLAKLANIPMPHLRTQVKQLTEIRMSEDTFADWRAALSNALREVQEISENDHQWERHAREILRDGLEPARARAAKVVKTSRFLTQATAGVRGFAFAGIGAATGSLATGGSVIGGIAGAATAKSAEIVTTALLTLRERRRNRAILDLILGIEDQNEHDAS